MRLAFAEPAARDLEDIIDYIALDSPTAAETVYRAIVAAAERLCDFPEAGRPGRLPRTREWRVVSLPYVIVYQVRDDAVMVLAVFHGARDLRRALADRRTSDGFRPCG
jgi:toxin ParE1/3/4